MLANSLDIPFRKGIMVDEFYRSRQIMSNGYYIPFEINND